jgi:hypothetical protein
MDTRSTTTASLALALLLALPASLPAAHYVEEGNGCYSCHTLAAAESDPATRAIASVSRTLSQIRAVNGGKTPARLGCTYCHSNPANAAMRGVLGHFQARLSKHPVGVNFLTRAATNGVYLSTVGSTTPGETDCADCHDPALLAPGLAEEGGSYVDHAPPEDPRRAGNPLMLRLVAAPRHYDDLCRLCHGAAAPPFKGRDVRVVSHADAAAAPIQEADGTALRATAAGGDAQCTACHDTHFSGEARLFNDGHEGDVAIVGSDCTAVCHYAGDAGGGYLTRGHGRQASTYRYRAGRVEFGPRANTMDMRLACTACHESLDTSNVSAARHPHVERLQQGTPQERYRARFKLSLPVQGWDAGSSFGSPLVGICGSCHASCAPHRAAGGGAGCQDCHEPHGRRAGRANLFMIPILSRGAGTYVPAARPRSGTKAVLYTVSRLDPETGVPRTEPLDFFRGSDRAGVCDSVECHPAAAPLADFMAGGKHPGGEQAPGADCGTCHSHADPDSAFHAP